MSRAVSSPITAGARPAAEDARRAVVAAPHAVEATVKRAVVRELFTTIAPGYDRFNRLASLGLDQRWRWRAVTVAALRPGMRVLDVCCGTGDLALRCARELGGDGVVVGLDFTEAMLDGARRKSSDASPVAWLRADAMTMPFATGAFDRVVIGFSTRNLARLAEGLRELVRVLKPGGQLIIVETGWPANPIVRAAYLAFLGTVVRAIGVLVTGRLWPFTYLARSVRAFVSPAELCRLLTDCDTDARYVPLTGGLASLFVATKRGAA